MTAISSKKKENNMITIYEIKKIRDIMAKAKVKNNVGHICFGSGSNNYVKVMFEHGSTRFHIKVNGDFNASKKFAYAIKIKDFLAIPKSAKQIEIKYHEDIDFHSIHMDGINFPAKVTVVDDDCMKPINNYTYYHDYDFMHGELESIVKKTKHFVSSDLDRPSILRVVFNSDGTFAATDGRVIIEDKLQNFEMCKGDDADKFSAWSNSRFAFDWNALNSISKMNGHTLAITDNNKIILHTKNWEVVLENISDLVFPEYKKFFPRNDSIVSKICVNIPTMKSIAKKISDMMNEDSTLDRYDRIQAKSGVIIKHDEIVMHPIHGLFDEVVHKFTPNSVVMEKDEFKFALSASRLVHVLEQIDGENEWINVCESAGVLCIENNGKKLLLMPLRTIK
jgi:hypothetical protein